MIKKVIISKRASRRLEAGQENKLPQIRVNRKAR
jgi:hypothetical protein